MYNNHTMAVVITAAGSGTRMNTDKMLMSVLGKSVILHTLDAFLKCGFFDEIIIAASKNNISQIGAQIILHNAHGNIRLVEGGSTRGESVIEGLREISSEYVLVHDGARMLICSEIIKEVADACIKTGAAAAGVKAKDTIKTSDNGIITSTVPRESCVLIQTPQGFNTASLKDAYARFGTDETDDCSVMEKAGARIKIVNGSYENLKLTTPEDIITAESILKKRFGQKEECAMRIGTGFDTHRLTAGRELIIGGVKIPYEKGLLGHSDADVLIHAVIDSLLGAGALGDIGTHFPDTDEKYKGISGMKLLSYTAQLIQKAGYTVGNIDTTIIAQAPKMAPYIDEMRKNIANALGVDVSKISIKAKTNEKMGFTGRGEGIEARATALIFC